MTEMVVVFPQLVGIFAGQDEAWPSLGDSIK